MKLSLRYIMKPLLAFTTFLYTYNSFVKANEQQASISNTLLMHEGYPLGGENLCQEQSYCFQAFVYNVTSHETLLQIACISDLQDSDGDTLAATEKFITATTLKEIENDARLKTKLYPEEPGNSPDLVKRYQDQIIKDEFDIRQKMVHDVLFNSTYESLLPRFVQQRIDAHHFSFQFLQSIIQSLQIEYTPGALETYNQEYCSTALERLRFDGYEITHHLHMKYKGLPLSNASEFNDKVNDVTGNIVKLFRLSQAITGISMACTILLVVSYALYSELLALNAALSARRSNLLLGKQNGDSPQQSTSEKPAENVTKNKESTPVSLLFKKKDETLLPINENLPRYHTRSLRGKM